MELRGSKTIMCSVLFLDIVAYSKKSVSAQIAQKELFNTLLAKSIQDVPVDDRIILDTGDGAAITFLGDVEDVLKAVLTFRESLLTDGASMDPPLQVCMGINLGPVRLVKDINGRPNIVGDGINVAQRIMGFAKPGQILVSRSYFDAASRLSLEYAGMFYSLGTRADKHDREHEVYAIGKPGEASGKMQVGEDTLGLAVRQGFTQSIQDRLQGLLAAFGEASGQQRALYSGIAISALALLIVIVVKIAHHGETPQPVQETPVLATASAPMPAAPVKSAVAAASTTASKVEAASAVAEAESGKSSEHDKKKKSKSAKQEKDGHDNAGSASGAESRPAALASINIAVTPWGEIYLDGKKQGVSPPLDALNVTAGEHKLEIRNTTFSPYTVSVQLKAGERIKIKHKFGN